MPVSDFTWSISSQNQLPLFNVYGKKRKIAGSESGDHEEQDFRENSVCKRQCIEQNGAGDGMNEMLEVNHNIADSENLNLSPVHMQSQGTYFSPLHDQYSALREQTSAHHQSQVFNTSQEQQQTPAINQQPYDQNSASMIMDLNDETYSNVQIDLQHQDEVMAMDSDCVPDPQQYQIKFCDSMCVGGEKSPTSGRVRCFCRPSWDGLIDMRPYVSDYY